MRISDWSSDVCSSDLVELPLCDRNIPIIADDFVDPEFGTSCVKITGAHDFNAYSCALRHDLTLIVIFTLAAQINENSPEQFPDMERFEPRQDVEAQIVAVQSVVKRNGTGEQTD